MSVKPSSGRSISRRVVNGNVWLGGSRDSIGVSTGPEKFQYRVLQDEQSVGQAMFDELVAYSNEKAGDIVIVLLGGRGAQAMHRVMAKRALDRNPS